MNMINSSVCKCCGGNGTQTRNDGIVVLCPCCGGTGLPPNTVTY